MIYPTMIPGCSAIRGCAGPSPLPICGQGAAAQAITVTPICSTGIPVICTGAAAAPQAMPGAQAQGLTITPICGATLLTPVCGVTVISSIINCTGAPVIC